MLDAFSKIANTLQLRTPNNRKHQLLLRSAIKLRYHLIRLISFHQQKAMAADPITKNTVSDLLNYGVSEDDDPFKDIDETLRVRDDKGTLSPRAAKRKAEDDKENDILGLDEEVKITKKRKPIAKLDETRFVMLAISSYMPWYHVDINDRLDYYPKPASPNSVH
jgi:hypothetical protein